MNFNFHIDEIIKKVTGTLIYLNRIKDTFETATRIIIVQSLALSLINYCSKVWGLTNATQIERVQKLQNFAARVAVGNIRKYDHITPAFKQLKWLKIEQKCFYDIGLFVFKVLNHELPEWLFKFHNVNEVRAVSTRQRNNPFVPRINTEIGARMLTVRGPTIWNNIPKQVKESCSFLTFKQNFKKYLLAK